MVSSIVSHQSTAPWLRRDNRIDAMQLSEAPFTHNTLHHRFFRGGHLASHVEHDINPAIYETGYNSFSCPILEPPIYSNPHNYTMEPLSREELERFQKLSNDYEPEVQVRILAR